MKRKNTISLCVTLAILLLFSACGSSDSTQAGGDVANVGSAGGYDYTTDDLEKVIYGVTEEENKDSFKDSNKLTCIMIAKGSGSSKDTYLELTIPKEFVQEDFEMPYYVNNSISLPLIVNNYSGDYTLSIKLSEHPDGANLEELLTANMPSALKREIVSAPNGNDASYKAVYDEKDSNNPWQRTRHGMKYLKKDSDNAGKDIIVFIHADFGSYTSLEIDDIYKILDAIEVKYMDSAKVENIINDYIRESLGIDYDDSTVVQIPYAISSVLNSSYRRDTDRENVNWTVKELREVTDITLKDYRYDEYDNYVLTESDKDWIQYLTCVTSVTIEGAADISNIDFITCLPSLQKLYISNCDNLTDIGAIQDFSSLQKLSIGNCNSLTDIGAIQNLSSLQQLSIWNCNSLTDIGAIQDLSSLQELYIEDCNSLIGIGAIQDLPSLQILRIERCNSLTNIGAMQNLPSLWELTFVECSNLSIDMNDVINFKGLISLTIYNCAEVINPDFIDTLSTLPNFYGYNIYTPSIERYGFFQ